jgi:hypothetical protein
MRGRIYSLVVSLALAFCLWLSLTGLDTSLADLTVGLRLHSLPEHLAIQGETPKVLTLRIRANAAQVRFLSDHKLSLPLDLSQAREGSNSFPVLLEPLNLPRGVEVTDINPGVIEFEALELSRKEVPVKPNVVGQPPSDFRLENLVLEPAAVTIQGPAEILAQVDHLETTPLAVDGLTKDAVVSIGVIPPEGAVTIVGVKEIQATVSVSEIRTQAVFSGIPVEVEIEARSRDQNYSRFRNLFGRPGNLEKDAPDPGEGPASFIAQPARVSVTISWPSSRSRPVDAREVRARVGVDAEQLKAEGRITVPVVVVPPPGTSVTAINPAMVGVSHVPPSAETRKPKVKQ